MRTLHRPRPITSRAFTVSYSVTPPASSSPAELIERVKKNTDLVEELLPLLPEDISYYLLSQEFKDACEKRFDECDGQ